MAVEVGTGTGNVDLTSLLKGVDMGNIFGTGSGADGTGGGLIGGLILGSLLRNNGNLLGGNNGVVDGIGAGGAMLRTPPEQATANMSLMAGIGDVKQAVAVSAANAETSNATQTGMLSGQISGVAAALTSTVTMAKDAATQNAVTLMQQLNGVSTNIMENRYELSKDVFNDGDKTRAAIAALAERLPTRAEIDLECQLGVAQSQILHNRTLDTIREGNVTVTTTVTQNQAQQQQQAQIANLGNLVNSLIAEQRVTQGVLNIGSGTVSGNSQNAANTRVA